MKITALFALLLLLSGCAGVKLTTKEVCGKSAYELSNRYVSADIVPEMSGVFTQLKSRGFFTSHMLTKPSKFTEETDDLLPSVCEQNDAGGRACLWKNPIRPYRMKPLQAQVTPEGRGIIEMHCRYWLATDLELTRRITLAPDESRFQLTTLAVNGGSKDVTVQLWENFSGRLVPGERSDELIFPVKGKVSRIGRDSARLYPEDGLAIKNPDTDRGAYRMAPNGNWMARRRSNAPLLVIRFPEGLGKNGLFYTHYGPDSTVNTSEGVKTPILLKPGEKTSLNIEYLIFAGLDNVNALCGDVAINCRLTPEEIVFSLASCRKVDAGLLKVPGTGEAHIGTLCPGKSRSFRFKRPAKPGKSINGSLSNIGSFSCYMTP